jgi:hypothetical protein
MDDCGFVCGKPGFRCLTTEFFEVPGVYDEVPHALPAEWGEGLHGTDVAYFAVEIRFP